MSNRKTFIELLENKWSQKKTICIGLDPDYEKIPQSIKKNSRSKTETMLLFNKKIIDATKNFAAAFKPNSAFYEKHGKDGVKTLQQTVEYIMRKYPDIPVLLDAKRADIGNTNKGYVKYAFDYIKADAITLHPYLGKEALNPFLKRKEKGLFILVKTSNPGASEFQNLLLKDSSPVYLTIAKNIATKWNANRNCCIVAGATYPKDLARIREVVGDIPILIPGIGKQGGDLKSAVKAGLHKKRIAILISSSRSILYASSRADFAVKAKKETERLHEHVLRYLE